MKSNYLFYFCDSIGSVFDSQVLALVEAINQTNYFKKIYLFLGIKNKNQHNEILKRNITEEVELIYYKNYPNYLLFNYAIRKELRKIIKNTNINLEEVIFHTRGEVIAWHLSIMLGLKYRGNIIPDIRGATYREVEEYSTLWFLLKILKLYNYKKSLINLTKFNQLSVISNSLKEYLAINFKVDPNKINVINCLSGPNFIFDQSRRTKIRRELKLNDDNILIVFSTGGTAAWQNNETIVRLANRGLIILNLSKKQINHKNIITKFISYTEMPSYLNAADVAIIWRDKSVVNKVASPVKFSEYVCCGLPVIANQNVDLIKEYLTQYNCGLLIDKLDDIEVTTLKALNQMDHQKISKQGILNFGVDTIVNKYLRVYSSM